MRHPPEMPHQERIRHNQNLSFCRGAIFCARRVTTVCAASRPTRRHDRPASRSKKSNEIVDHYRKRQCRRHHHILIGEEPGATQRQHQYYRDKTPRQICESVCKKRTYHQQPHRIGDDICLVNVHIHPVLEAFFIDVIPSDDYRQQ